MQGGSTLKVAPGASAVTMNFAGTGTTTPVDWTGGTFYNPSYVPENFQIRYAGTGGVKLAGGSAASLMLYAPNSDVTLNGGSDFYGSLLGKTIKDMGGTKMHYDRHIPSEFGTAGNAMLSSFTWKKF
jgi:hypothetical protein